MPPPCFRPNIPYGCIWGSCPEPRPFSEFFSPFLVSIKHVHLTWSWMMHMALCSCECASFCNLLLGHTGHWRMPWMGNTVSENWISCLSLSFLWPWVSPALPWLWRPLWLFLAACRELFPNPFFSLPSLNLTFAPVSFLMSSILQLTSDSGSLGHILFVWVCLRDHRFLCLRIQRISMRLGVRATSADDNSFNLHPHFMLYLWFSFCVFAPSLTG